MKWGSFLFSCALNGSVVFSFAVTYLIFDMAVRAMMGDSTKYPSNIFDLHLNGEQSLIGMFVAIAGVNVCAFLLEGAQLMFRLLERTVWTKRIAYFTMLFVFLSLLAIEIPGVVLISNLKEAKKNPGHVTGSPFEPFIQLESFLKLQKFNVSKPKYSIKQIDNQKMSDLQSQVDKLQEDRKCCGLDSWEFWLPLTVPDQIKSTVTISDSADKISAVWWDDCHRQKMACSVPRSCCDTTEGKMKKFCNKGNPNKNVKPKDVYANGCKESFVSHLQRFLSAILIMQAGKMLLTVAGCSLTLIEAALLQREMDDYYTDTYVKEIKDQITEEEEDYGEM